MTKPLRIAFMGTPDFVCPTVQSLIDGSHDLVCIYTQPPREKGRHKKLEKTPVHIMAENIGIEVRYPIDFKSLQDVQAFEDLKLDVAIVAAFGMLLPQNILDAPKFGCINIHPSLLPRWRGPSPVQYALWKGDEKTGVSVMSLEKSMDTGPIIAQEKCLIDTLTTFETLNHDLWVKGTNLLSHCLEELSKTRELKSTPQDENAATYCKLLTKEDGHINFVETATQIDCQIRGLNPWPGTWCLDGAGKRLKIIQATILNEKTDKKFGTVIEDGKISCGDNTVLQLQKIQPENKNVMGVSDALNGGYLKQGDILS